MGTLLPELPAKPGGLTQAANSDCSVWFYSFTSAILIVVQSTLGFYLGSSDKLRKGWQFVAVFMSSNARLGLCGSGPKGKHAKVQFTVDSAETEATKKTWAARFLLFEGMLGLVTSFFGAPKKRDKPTFLPDSTGRVTSSNFSTFCCSSFRTRGRTSLVEFGGERAQYR